MDLLCVACGFTIVVVQVTLLEEFHMGTVLVKFLREKNPDPNGNYLNEEPHKLYSDA